MLVKLSVAVKFLRVSVNIIIYFKLYYNTCEGSGEQLFRSQLTQVNNADCNGPLPITGSVRK